jgi:plastocyanin
MELNKLRLSQIDTSDIETSDFASQTQVDSVQSNLSSYASYANTTFGTGGGTATGNGVVFSTSTTTDASNAYSLAITNNGMTDWTLSSGYDRTGAVSGNDANVYIEEGDVISITNNAGSAHPLYIKYNSSVGVEDAVAGVLNQGASDGATLSWDTSVGDAGVYFYQCASHLEMNGYLVVESTGTYTSTDYYSLSNVFSLPQSVEYKENLLVYINGLLQHPDAYSISSANLTLANSDPLPVNMKISVRELAVAGGLANVALANVSEARASNAANGTLTFDYEGSNLYIYDGTVAGGYYLPLTQAVALDVGATFQGSTSGYSSGGYSTVYSNVIDKFPFVSDANATDVGDLTVARRAAAGQSSEVSGYTSGGYASMPPTPGDSNVIDKFPFAADGNATDVGDLTLARNQTVGQSSEVSGYTSDGSYVGGYSTVIDKFPFASDTNATDVGDLMLAKEGGAGQSSTTFGYSSGGFVSPYTNVIQKFPFSSDTNATDVGDLTVARRYATGQSSTASGYTSGGANSIIEGTIDKFPFATDANATDVGDLSQARALGAGQSSTASGYTSGGSGPANSNVIDKFPFAADGNATDVSDLTIARTRVVGQQV